MPENNASSGRGGVRKRGASEVRDRMNQRAITEESADRPVVLLVTSVHHDKTARLAVALSRLGCQVAALCPPRHWIRFVPCVYRRLPYAALQPLRSLHRAIREVMPDLIIPCDDRAVRHMHRLFTRVSEGDVRKRLARSLSPAEEFSLIESRVDLLMLARDSGVPVPDTQPVTSQGDLATWGATHPLPWVLKSDGSWAGMGVRVVATLAEAMQAFQEMRRPVSARFVMGQCLLEWDFFWLTPWLTRERPTISVQQHIPGRAANCAIACWHGELLAGVAVETVASRSTTEPATIVRVVEGTDMLQSAERVVRALQLTGLVGFDFQLHAETGAPYLLELNSRAVPLCHLPLGEGRDLAHALTSRLSKQPSAPRPAVTPNQLIAYFPDAITQDPSNPMLPVAYHDVPWDERALLLALLRPPSRWQRWIVQGVRACTGTVRAVRRKQIRANWSKFEEVVELQHQPGDNTVRPL